MKLDFFQFYSLPNFLFIKFFPYYFNKLKKNINNLFASLFSIT
jgi:hypothetical protein